MASVTFHAFITCLVQHAISCQHLVIKMFQLMLPRRARRVMQSGILEGVFTSARTYVIQQIPRLPLQALGISADLIGIMLSTGRKF